MAGTTVNFTGAIDRDLLKRAKIVAAKSDTSVGSYPPENGLSF